MRLQGPVLNEADTHHIKCFDPHTGASKSKKRPGQLVLNSPRVHIVQPRANVECWIKRTHSHSICIWNGSVTKSSLRCSVMAEPCDAAFFLVFFGLWFFPAFVLIIAGDHCSFYIYDFQGFFFFLDMIHCKHVRYVISKAKQEDLHFWITKTCFASLEFW